MTTLALDDLCSGSSCLVFADNQKYATVGQFLRSDPPKSMGSWDGTTFYMMPFSEKALGKLLLVPYYADTRISNAFVDLSPLTTATPTGVASALLKKYLGLANEIDLLNGGKSFCRPESVPTRAEIKAFEDALLGMCDPRSRQCTFASLETTGQQESTVTLTYDEVFPVHTETNTIIDYKRITIKTPTPTPATFQTPPNSKGGCNRYIIDGEGFTAENLRFQQQTNCPDDPKNPLPNVPFVFTGDSGKDASITDVVLIDGTLGVSAVGGTATVFTYSPLINVDGSSYDITSKYTSEQGLDSHIIAAYARAIGVAEVAFDSSSGTVQNPYFKSLPGCESSDSDSVVYVANDKSPINVSSVRQVFRAANDPIEGLYINKNGSLVGTYSDDAEAVSAKKVTGSIYYQLVFQRTNVPIENLPLFFDGGDSNLHPVGEPYLCLTWVDHSDWDSEPVRLLPCLMDKIGYGSADVAPKSFTAPLQVFPDGTLQDKDSAMFSNISELFSLLGETTFDATPCRDLVDAGQPCCGLLIASCVKRPLQELYDVSDKDKGLLCSNSGTNPVQIYGKNAFGALYDCDTQSLLKRGYGFSVFGNLEYNVSNGTQLSSSSVITRKAVIQPLSHEEFALVAPGIEVINITEFTGVFGAAIEQEIYGEPPKSKTLYVASNIVLGAINGMLILMHIGLVLFSADARRKFVYREE